MSAACLVLSALLAAPTVAVEVRVLRLPAGAFGAFGLPGADAPTTFGDATLRRVLDAAQGHRLVSILQFPLLIVADGQRVDRWAGDEAGVAVRPTLAADRRTIALEVGFQQAGTDGAVPPRPRRWEVRQAATVADGETLLFAGGGRTRWEDRPSGPLAGVPVLGRLTTTRTAVREEAWVLVTPRGRPAGGR